MPELPEVEVTRIGLADRLADARVLSVRMGKPLRWPLGCDPASLVGQRVGPMSRRGKYLWLPLSQEVPDALPSANGATEAASATDLPRADGGLLIHLGMSGSLGWTDSLSAPGPHDHFDLETTRGAIRLTDPRRFGAVLWSPGLNLDPARKLLAGLGAEPFDARFTAADFHVALRARRRPVKLALLAGDIVVGAGNIYASEALFQAGIDPRIRCDRLSRPRSERLLAAVRQTLAQAIALGGSTLRDFRDAHGMSGAFQQQAQVYGREGLPCRRCGAPVRRIVQAQRATYFCAACQHR